MRNGDQKLKLEVIIELKITFLNPPFKHQMNLQTPGLDLKNI